MTIKKLLLALLAIGAMTACKDDTDDVLEQAQKDAATALLNGEMVVSAHTSINGADKTLLDGGAPCKFKFEPDGDGQLKLSMEDFQIGKMPFALCFKIKLSLGPILSFEKNDFSESGWVRFSGKRGVISFGGPMPEKWEDDTVEGDGSTVTGYVNTETKEIQFELYYAAMNVVVSVKRQKIDPSRVANYETEKEEYEKALEEYKKEHGMQ